MGMKITLRQLRRVISEVVESEAEREELASMYSDVYKEKHGIRPRWMRFEDMSTDELRSALQELTAEGDCTCATAKFEDDPCPVHGPEGP